MRVAVSAQVRMVLPENLVDDFPYLGKHGETKTTATSEGSTVRRTKCVDL